MQMNLKTWEDIYCSRTLVLNHICNHKHTVWFLPASHFLKITCASKCNSVYSCKAIFVLSSLLHLKSFSSYSFLLTNEYVGMAGFLLKSVKDWLLSCYVFFFIILCVHVICVIWIKGSFFCIFQVQAIFSVSSIATWGIWRSRPLYTGFSIDRRSTESHINWMYKVYFCALLLILD